MNKTKISYLTHTWNPTTGCSSCSDGCRSCWAERMSKRLKGRYGYPADEPFRPTFHKDRLFEPYGKSKPLKIGVSFMSDLFHPDFSDDEISDVFVTMGTADDHTYFVLTKRPQRMKEFVERWLKEIDHDSIPAHIWLGITICNQAEADEKIPILLSIPAAKRWISVEPMLGPIKLERHWLRGECIYGCESIMQMSCDRQGEPCPERDGGIDFIALGGESGPGARPLHPDWVRSVRDQCQAAGVPFMFKQWGEWVPTTEVGFADTPKAPTHVFSTDKVIHIHGGSIPFGIEVRRVGKKKAVRRLDGKEYLEMP